MSEYVRIFDTTLRDGEQSPGATMTSAEKLEVARGLARLGVDVIEAGFPAASPDDLEAVRRIAIEVGNSADGGRVPIICGLARATKNDIDKAWQAVQPAAKPRIHTFLATSEIHMQYKLRMTRQQVLDRVAEMVAYARSLCEDVEFSPEDAGRSDPAFLYEVLAVAIRAGATTLNIPDTVGYTTPDEFGALIAGIIKNTPGIDNCIVSVHCHNDLGLATANTLAGLRAGARQAEVTINGIGERAGNTALEEVVMALKSRRDLFGVETGINTREIMRTSRLVSSITGIRVQPNKAIVGANAFAHSSGIHQDGVLKERTTYEIIDPAEVGAGVSRIVLTARSGRHALRHRLEELGFALTDDEFERVYEAFLDVADKKKEVYDEDLEAIVGESERTLHETYHLQQVHVSCGEPGIPTATVELVAADGRHLIDSSHGNGPVDAVYNAINRIVQVPNDLTEFSVQSVTRGIDAIGEVTIRIRAEDGQVFTGRGAHPDIIVASAKAYTNALNRLLSAQKKSVEEEL